MNVTIIIAPQISRPMIETIVNYSFCMLTFERLYLTWPEYSNELPI